MGWSFSPFIAQSISMAIVLNTLERCKIDFDRYKNLSTPFIRIENQNKEVILVAAVWYDSIVLFTSLPNVALRFFQHCQNRIE
jgi:hypothetical protein